MQFYQKTDIRKSLGNLGLDKGDVLYVTGNLQYFGKCKDAKGKEDVLSEIYHYLERPIVGYPDNLDARCTWI